MLRVMRISGFMAAGESELSRQHWMFEQQALQEYILLCCQNPTGGLLDKPGKSVPHHLDTHTTTHSNSLQSNMSHMVLLIHINPPTLSCGLVFRSRDFYHTCYCLSGLSIAQHFGNMDLHHELILGKEENRLVRLQITASAERACLSSQSFGDRFWTVCKINLLHVMHADVVRVKSFRKLLTLFYKVNSTFSHLQCYVLTSSQNGDSGVISSFTQWSFSACYISGH